MPLKLTSFTIKKRGGYNLNDCNFYILAVQMLDGSILQCTLKIASTGEDCMQYIMQKLELQRNLYFGLKYKCSPTVYRWIDFRKPLKKQLMKHAYEFKLYFSVMFYVSNPELLSNSTERYCYYLQLKSDIITGRLFGPPEKSILCASYSLQAEFGDYDPLKQNEESLRNFTLLPLHMTKSAQILEGIAKQALHGHERLKGVSQADAELAYIKEAKHFDGYGEEYFTGHDEEKAEVFLGYCLSGIVVKRIQSSPVIYGWKEIKKITFNNRRLYLDCFEINHRIVFHMEDVTNAEYVAFLFGLQLEFDKRFGNVLQLPLPASNGKTYFSRFMIQKTTPLRLNGSSRSKTRSFTEKIDSGFEDCNNSLDTLSRNRCIASVNGNPSGDFLHQSNDGSRDNNSPICAGFSNIDLNSNFGSKSSMTNSRATTTTNSCLHLHNNGTTILPPYRPAPDYNSLFKDGAPSADAIRPLSTISTSMPYLNLAQGQQPNKNNSGRSASISEKHGIGQSLSLEASAEHVLAESLPTTSNVKNEQIDYMSKTCWSKIANFNVDLHTSVRQKQGLFVTSVLHLKDSVTSDQRRTIYHVQYVCGQNYHNDPESFVELLEEINSLQLLVEGDMLDAANKKFKNAQQSSPVFVHSASGFDWSGVFVLTHYALKLYHHHERCNMANILTTMRQSMQLNLVPYVEQYTFCHACLSNHAKKSRLI